MEKGTGHEHKRKASFKPEVEQHIGAERKAKLIKKSDIKPETDEASGKEVAEPIVVEKTERQKLAEEAKELADKWGVRTVDESPAKKKYEAGMSTHKKYLKD